MRWKLPETGSAINPPETKTKSKIQNTREMPIYSGQDFPDWLEPFTDNLEETETPAPAQVSQKLRFGTCYEESRKTKEAQFFHFPKCRAYDICLKIKITREGPVQQTHWRSRTSCRKFWWLDNSRSQSPQWQLRISKQSRICSRGAGFGHPMDPVVSVQNKNFSGNTKELAKVPGAE